MKMLAAVPLMLYASTAMADGWLSLGTGLVAIGSADYAEDRERLKVAVNAGFTLADQHKALRVRGTGFTYTKNSAAELAVLLGARVGKKQNAILGIGYSQLNDVSEVEDSTNGVSLELLYAPQRRGVVSFEASLHGNINSDHAFFGLLIAGRFGWMGRQK